MKTKRRLQMDHDVIPSLPEIRPDELQDECPDKHYRAFVNSPAKLMIYETEKGESEIVFSKLDERLFANMVAKLNYPDYLRVYNFLKLVLEGARLVMRNNQKAYDNAVRIEKYIKNQPDYLKEA